MMDETNQSPFFQDLNEIYKERELLFKQREQDYLKQKIALTNLMEVIKKEKGELEKTAEELERKQEELRKEEEYQQSWYQQICEEKKQMDKEREQIKIEKEDLNAKKDAIEVKFQIQIEKAKNTEILGKFYGNGHTISNLDFSENYGKTEYPSFGFFSEVYGAEISGLTIQGKLNVSNSGYVYFGTVAGVAADSKISDCASNVSFTDTDKYINGTVALCGYAINSTIEYCQNKGDFSITQDVTSFQMGGIVGLAQNSTVQYCANTGDLTSWTPCTGGIVGQLIQNSKVINCYSTGKIVPLGKGTTDFGGIAGTVGTGTEIRHCYFAGEVDLSQYTATTPYKRLGGIVGGVSSDTPVFENNYFIETENVTACSKYTEAGTAKSLEYMETEDFFNEITTAGGNYRFNSNGTPLLPAPKYAVSFVVTPAELANVVIKVNGQEVTNPVDLEAGTYTVEVSADNCEVFNLNITITADTATHTQTIAMTYLPADYTKVDGAIDKANALNKDNYKDFSAVEAAVKAVVRGKNIMEQSEVDKMAKAIEDAIAALEKKLASTKPGTSDKSPQTGDTSSLALWIVLLFTSGGAAIATTVVSRKKKYNR